MLSTLPTELLIQILDNTDFDSHLNLALTCRRVSACLKPTLARHRDAHKRCRHMTNAMDGTVRDLMRSVVGLDDPIDAWHVRALDLWTVDDCGWDDDVHWPWSMEEKDMYTTFFSQYFVPDKVEQYMDLVEKRDLDFLKVVLFYSLPRLREIRFIGHGSNYSLHELYRALSDLKEGHLPILQQLDTVFVNVPMRDYPNEDDSVGHRTLLNLMRLPQLRTLYCYGLDADYDRLGPFDELSLSLISSPAGFPTSSLEHLYLDHVRSWPSLMHLYQDCIARIPAALKSFAIRSSFDSEDLDLRNIRVDDCALRVLNRQDKTIQSCVVYDPHFNYPGLTCTAKMPKAPGWRLNYPPNYSIPTLSSEAALQRSLDTHISYFTTEVAASGLSDLCLRGDDPSQLLGWPEGVDVLEEAVVTLIRSNKNPRLTTIHLLGFEDKVGQVEKTHGKIRFQKAIIEGIKHSVDVYTDTTPRPLVTWGEIENAPFGMAFKGFNPIPTYLEWYWPDQWDVGRRQEKTSCVLNVRTGEWEDSRCNRCENCEICFKQYPKESWVAAKEEREAARKKRGDLVEEA